MPGCRDAVENGKTGFLVRPRDVDDLLQKMEAMVGMPRNLLEKMGSKGRERVLEKFDERLVTRRYLAEVERVAGSR